VRNDYAEGHENMKLRKNSRAYKILKRLAIGGGFIVLSTIAPQSGTLIVRSLLRDYFRRKRFERYRWLNDLKNLQKRELVDYRELGDGRIKITITRRGKMEVLTYRFDHLKLQRPARWDRRWRLVMFDIPSGCKKARDAFRQKLRSLEFYPLQKSVFITPFPCEKEIDFLASIFDVQKYTLLLYVSGFEGEEKLRHHFKI